MSTLELTTIEGIGNVPVAFPDGLSGALNGTVGATTANSVNATTLTTSGNVTHNGGTANGVTYLNASKVLTSGSALTFDGSNLAVSGSAEIDGTITTGISTSAVQIYAPSLTSGKTVTFGLLIVAGYDASSNSFVDLVPFFANATSQTPTAIAGGAVYGSPAARTYSGGFNSVRLSMASGTYTTVVSPFKLSC